MVTPSIGVGVICYLGSCAIINSYNISLQILFKPEDIKGVDSIACSSIHHTNRSAGCIVEINQKLISPLFGYYLTTIKLIGMSHTIYRFARSNAIIVIGEGHSFWGLDRSCNLSACTELVQAFY